MLNNVDLDVLRKLQLLGLDQTANLGRYFGGADKIVELAKIDFYKERVLDGAFYLSQKDSEYLVADMLGGDVIIVDTLLRTDFAIRKYPSYAGAWPLPRPDFHRQENACLWARRT
jgi:hypothetical protein